MSGTSKAAWLDVPQPSVDALAEATGTNASLLATGEPGIFVLPSNRRLTQPRTEWNVFEQPTKRLLTALREAGLSPQLYDDGKEKRELMFRAADVTLPVVVFIGGAALDVALGVLAAWIYDQWIKPDPTALPSIRAEYAEIGPRGDVVRWRRVEGRADEVRRLLLEESGQPAGPSAAASLEAIEGTGTWVSYRKKQAQAAIIVAEELIKRAEQALDRRKPREAEPLYRESLSKLREATLWEPEEKGHRTYLHQVGHWVHDTFSCHFEFEEGQYRVKCPVLLSHSRIGVSIGGAAKVICSLCAANILECPHAQGHRYDRVMAKRRNGRCNICREERCAHVEGQAYDGAIAYGIGTDISLDHVAVVENPADPMCATYGYSLSQSEVMQMLPEEDRALFIHGKSKLWCHHCLICTGVIGDS